MNAGYPAADETVFTYGAPLLKFGVGAAGEIGYDLSQYGARRVLLITDKGMSATGIPQRVADAMTSYGIETVIYDGVHVEPTDDSIRAAVAAAASSAAGTAAASPAAAEAAGAGGTWDAFVAVGGGSSIDTAKAVNLLTTNDGDLEDYLNAPVGSGRAPSRPLKPLIAVPTTTGTGSESTTICVLDVLSLHVKTGISHPRLRPALAIVDPALTLTQPPGVTASTGMDILCHALESFTARPYTTYPRKTPEQRVPYCGANPISDMWSERALTLLAGSFRTAVRRGDDQQARGAMALAATMAGLGFGNSGVHIPHANAYPIAGRVKDFHPAGYPADEPLVPHGMAVSLTAPEAFRFTFDAAPQRHLHAAALLAPELADVGEPRDRLPTAVIALMRDIGIPNGIGGVGYAEAAIPDLVEGAMKQQRLLATAPRPVTEDDLAGVFARSIQNW